MDLRQPDLYGIESLSFEKTGEKFRTQMEEKSMESDGITERNVKQILMDDIRIIVRKTESEGRANVEGSAGSVS